MAVDTPATIAVLGAGPVGLETALYARFLGYRVDIYEQGGVADHVLRWGHVRMFSPFGHNRSTLGLAALKAHDASFRPPADDALLTGREWAERYLIPLAQTDLLADSLRTGTRVVAVGREGVLKTERVDDPSRGETPFRILLCDEDQRQRTASADVVIDVTGVYGSPNPMGAGGIPAVGETEVRDRIHYHLPDVRGREQAKFAGRHTLVVGAGYSAAAVVVALCDLATEAPGTQITWVVRRDLPSSGDGPIARIDNDPLAERDRLAREANRYAVGDGSPVSVLAGTRIQSVHWDSQPGRFVVELVGQNQGCREFDQVVCHTGFRPDRSVYRELQVHECYATESPMNLASWLRGKGSDQDREPPASESQMLCCTESHFYILGSKSYGRNSDFLFATGLEQIRRLFSRIGDRVDLDLYANVEYLIS